jgi:hypothetical protein
LYATISTLYGSGTQGLSYTAFSSNGDGQVTSAQVTEGLLLHHHVVLDCPDPAALAAFYSALLGLPVTYRDNDWVVVAANDGPGVYADPAGHPFCLIRRPRWAPPIPEDT